LCLRLNELGYLNLEQTLTEVLPQFKGNPAWQGITLAHLLSHTHGLDFSVALSTVPATMNIAGFVAEYCADPQVLFQPGEMFCYTMMGHIIAGYLCEVVMQKHYLQLIRDYITDPLNISVTLDVNGDSKGSVTEGNIVQEGKLLAVEDPRHCQALLPSGALGFYMSAQALLRVGQSLIPSGAGGTCLLKDSSIARVFASQTAVENHPVIQTSGLSFFQLTNGFWGHLGDGDGQHSYIQIDPVGATVMVCCATVYPAAAMFWALAAKNFIHNTGADQLREAARYHSIPIDGTYHNALTRVETVRTDTGYELRLYRSLADKLIDKQTCCAIKATDEKEQNFQLVRPDRIIKGSITYFGNSQGEFMRIGQLLLKKTGV
jgi:CubicO group peptidase (beta-lactamase class C family)